MIQSRKNIYGASNASCSMCYWTILLHGGWHAKMMSRSRVKASALIKNNQLMVATTITMAANVATYVDMTWRFHDSAFKSEMLSICLSSAAIVCVGGDDIYKYEEHSISKGDEVYI